MVQEIEAVVIDFNLVDLMIMIDSSVSIVVGSDIQSTNVGIYMVNRLIYLLAHFNKAN